MRGWHRAEQVGGSSPDSAVTWDRGATGLKMDKHGSCPRLASGLAGEHKHTQVVCQDPRQSGHMTPRVKTGLWSLERLQTHALPWLIPAALLSPHLWAFAPAVPSTWTPPSSPASLASSCLSGTGPCRVPNFSNLFKAGALMKYRLLFLIPFCG